MKRKMLCKVLSIKELGEFTACSGYFSSKIKLALYERRKRIFASPKDAEEWHMTYNEHYIPIYIKNHLLSAYYAIEQDKFYRWKTLTEAIEYEELRNVINARAKKTCLNCIHEIQHKLTGSCDEEFKSKKI